MVINRGEAANSMLIVLFGSLGVFDDDANLIQHVHPNQAYGERAIRISEPRKHTVVAMEVTVLVELYRDDFSE